MLTVIEVFEPKGRSKDITIQSLIPDQTVDALRKRFGVEAADKAKSAIRSLDRLDGDFVQFRHGDRRIRVKKG